MKGRFAILTSLGWSMLTAVVLSATFVVTPRPAAATNNIIVFVADDLGWNDLPYFSEPVDWAGVPQDWPDGEGAVRRWDASMNRFAARTYAESTGETTPELGHRLVDRDDFAVVEVKAADWKHADGTAPSQYVTTAVCSGTGCPGGDANNCGSVNRGETPSRDACTQARSDVIEGFGGLAYLARTGLVFPRFYANSSKCGPSRAALMTGKYPKRAGVTLNGGQLDAAQITIAEYLKQGCAASGTPIEKQCRYDGRPGAPCGCFVEAETPTNECATTAGLPCYSTGLIGKYHLGSKHTRAVWNQGFDEYFGFGGGSRHYWNTDDLQCGPAPLYVTGVNTQVDDKEICTSLGDFCTARGLYVGTKRFFNDCRGDRGDQLSGAYPDCCVSKKKDGKSRGNYNVALHLTNSSTGAGKDSHASGLRPCSDPGITKDEDCAYLTRVLRDHARNFIVRNAPHQPFFLMVTFHAPHFGFASPLRTEDHHRSKIKPTGTDPAVETQPKEPGSATKYWGIIEEMDAAVGQVLDLLEHTGVCQENPGTECTGNDTGCTCLPMGTYSNGDPDELCLTDDTVGSKGACLPPKARTSVFFFSDHGRPGGHTYGMPDLRGGKGDVTEGGIRVGMLARHPVDNPNIGVCVEARPMRPCANNSDCGTGDECVGPYVCSETVPLETCDPAADPDTCTESSSDRCVALPERRVEVVASIADLFPTIAEIAGFDSSYFSSGRSCLSADCNKTTDGRSFLWALEDPSSPPTPSGVNYPRKRVFAAYPSDGMTVVTTEDDTVNSGTDYDVCAYDSRNDVSTGAATYSRQILGASCLKPAIGCNTSNDAWCQLPGRVCVPETDSEIITSSSTCEGNVCLKRTWFDPTQAKYALYPCKRSNNECSGTLKCKSKVWIRCNTVATDTLWKLKTPQPPQGSPAWESTKNQLYELRSNPSEDDAINCQGATSGVNSEYLLSKALFDGPTEESALGLAKWHDCTTNFDCSGGPP